MFIEKKNISQKIGSVLENQTLLYGLILFGLLVKLFLLPEVADNGDYELFVEPWVRFIKNHGYINALKYDFSNYPPVYLYILTIIAKVALNPLSGIKIVSIVFEYLTAFFIGKILYDKTGKSYLKLAAFAFYPLLPTVLINSSYWAQCDSIYTAFIIGSLYFFFKNKKWFCGLFLGLAFSFKFQTVIILPFYFVLLLRNKIQWYYFLLIPIVYFLSIIPAWIVGRPLDQLLSIYLMQSVTYESLTLNFPNIYVWINNDNFYEQPNVYNLPILKLPMLSSDYYPLLKNAGLIFTALFCLVIGVVLKNKKYVFTPEAMLKLAFLSSILIPFVLPGMHERYMFLGDALALIYFFLFMKRLYIPIGVWSVSLASYLLCTRLHYFIPIHLLSIFYLFLITSLVVDFWKTIRPVQK